MFVHSFMYLLMLSDALNHVQYLLFDKSDLILRVQVCVYVFMYVC